MIRGGDIDSASTAIIYKTTRYKFSLTISDTTDSIKIRNPFPVIISISLRKNGAVFNNNKTQFLVDEVIFINDFSYGFRII